MEKIMKVAEAILAEAKSRGADYAQCTVSESEKKEFNVDGGRFSLMRTLYNRNVVLTLLKDQRKGTVQLNRFEPDALKAAVGDALAACESGKPDPAWQFEDRPVEKDLTDGCPECDTERLFERSKELLENISERHPKILMEQMITEHDGFRRVFMTSNGVTYRIRGGVYGFSLMYSAQEGEKSSSFFGSEVQLKALDKPVIDCSTIEWELAAVEKQTDPKTLDGKFVGPVLMDPSALNEIVVDTIEDKFVSDSSLIEGTSIWKDKLGEEVADPSFTLSFEPFSEDVVLPDHYTPEGYPAANFDLIRDGRLAGFVLSQYGANRTGGTRAANAGSSVHIRPGNSTLEELIAGIDKGILMMRFSGGEPAASGEFSGVAKNSFMIRDGRIAEALSETMVSGCIPEMLKQIRGISSTLQQSGDTSLPYIVFDGLTISGK